MTDTPIPNNAIILVGDGRKALFLRNDGTPLHPKLTVLRLLEHDNPATRDQGSDRPGRYASPTGVGRSAVEQTDWHQLEESRFAQTIVETLQRAANANSMLQIVLVAPPRTMGDLRAGMQKSLRQHVIGEITRDLTAHPLAHIQKLLAMQSV